MQGNTRQIKTGGMGQGGWLKNRGADQQKTWSVPYFVSLNLGNTVSHIPILGGESVDITNREVTGSVTLDLDAAAEVAAMTEVNANTLTALGFQFGTTTGYKIQIYGPKVQRISPKKEDQDGRRLIGFDLRFTPNAGNDELRIVTL